MNKKSTTIERRDKKGRVLRNGECQRKDGRYQYEYVGLDKKTHCVYSWKLEPTDKLPKGKRKCKSLREQEQEIQDSISNHIIPNGGNLTVLDLVKKYVSTKIGVKETTRTGYNTVINFLSNNEFGSRRIDMVKPFDAKSWLIDLQKKDGKRYSTIHTIRGVLRPAFRMALDNELIRKNPFEFELKDVVANDNKERIALKSNQKEEFLEFIRTDNYFCRYYDAIYILFHTGMRISEFCGLTEDDIDFKNRKVTISKQLQRTTDMRYIIETPKTKWGTRNLPLNPDVLDCFKRIISKHIERESEHSVQDKKGKQYTNFLHYDKNGMPMVALHWEKYFEHICEKYSKFHNTNMPKVTPHICRHTYCTEMALSNMKPKHLQYLMGHSDIRTTLNIYTHLNIDALEEEVDMIWEAKHSNDSVLQDNLQD